MIEINLIDVSGFKGAIRGMRHPYESYEKSDSVYADNSLDNLIIGDTDLNLCKKLITAGSDHRKFLRMIHVQMDIRAPRFWWMQADTYKIGTTTNSQSTMHTIHKKQFELRDFSMEHILNPLPLIDELNSLRERYLETNDKKYWYALIELLPQSYMQTRTVDITYETLMRIAVSRRGHKLKEWTDFIEWMKKELPYFEEFLDAISPRKDKEAPNDSRRTGI